MPCVLSKRVAAVLYVTNYHRASVFVRVMFASKHLRHSGSEKHHSCNSDKANRPLTGHGQDFAKDFLHVTRHVTFDDIAVGALQPTLRFVVLCTSVNAPSVNAAILFRKMQSLIKEAAKRMMTRGGEKHASWKVMIMSCTLLALLKIKADAAQE